MNDMASDRGAAFTRDRVQRMAALQERFDDLIAAGQGSTIEAFAIANLLVKEMPDDGE